MLSFYRKPFFPIEEWLSDKGYRVRTSDENMGSGSHELRKAAGEHLHYKPVQPRPLQPQPPPPPLYLPSPLPTHTLFVNIQVTHCDRHCPTSTCCFKRALKSTHPITEPGQPRPLQP
jgi:hypothetical protein